MSCFDYRRRPTSEVRIGRVTVGADSPIAVQSMNNTSTIDIEGSVAQAERIARAGADIDRLTAQGVREAEALGEIRTRLRERGVEMPLVADIHFNPKAAFAAAERVDKVRINPGNFVDPGRVFKHIDYTDAEYAAELQKIDRAFVPFLKLCREHGTAIRIGVNHGSLSDRIMSRYGDTPAGMVESAMEFLRVARRENFTDIVISIKSSNTVVMTQTVRLLVRAMEAEDMHFPLHLGVTEAGDGEDGRIRSAVGIGSLLADGIGDTIRVSLSEEPEAEVPVARELVEYLTARAGAPSVPGEAAPDFDPVLRQRRPTDPAGKVGGTQVPVVAGYDDFGAETAVIDIDVTDDAALVARAAELGADTALCLVTAHANPVARLSAAIHALWRAGDRHPVIARLAYDGLDRDKVVIRASADFGSLLLNGLIDGLDIQADTLTRGELDSLALGILQAARCRVTKTEFVSCPGCGRTMFDLQETVRRVKAAVAGYPGLKIAVMGCVVNGPGEMADADYGYVGAGVGRVSLYRNKELIEKNIESDRAVDRLLEILRADGRIAADRHNPAQA